MTEGRETPVNAGGSCWPIVKSLVRFWSMTTARWVNVQAPFTFISSGISDIMAVEQQSNHRITYYNSIMVIMLIYVIRTESWLYYIIYDYILELWFYSNRIALYSVCCSCLWNCCPEDISLDVSIDYVLYCRKQAAKWECLTSVEPSPAFCFLLKSY